MSAVEEEVPATEQPLRKNRDFLLLWIGAGFTVLGGRVTAIAYPLLVLWHTKSASEAGLVGFMALLPNLVVQLPAGALVDRWDRRRLMIVSDIGCFLIGGVVAVAVYREQIWLPLLMTAAFLHGSLTIFYQLAERAGVPQLVPAAQLPAAMAQNEARSRAAALLGQPIGGLLFAFLSWTPFLFSAGTNLASLACILGIKKKFQSDEDRPVRQLHVEVASGIAWMWKQHFLRTVMGLVAVSNIIFQALLLALMLIVHNDGGSAGVVGVVAACAGIGGMAGALTGAWWMRRLSLRAIVIGGLVVWTVLIPPVAYLHSPALLGVVFALSGYVGGVFNVAGAVYMVRVASDSMRGRANSLANLVGSGGMALGPLAGGFLLDSFGSRDTVLWLAVVMALLAVLSIVSRSVREVVQTPEGRRLITPSRAGASADDAQ